MTAVGDRAPLGLVTIGQSPRVDVRPELDEVMGDPDDGGHPYVEHGALDDLSPAEIRALAPGQDEHPLVSRLRDGGRVTMSHRSVQPHLTAAVARCVDDGAGAVLVMCTGHLAPITASVPVHAAEPLAHHAALRRSANGRLGVIAPVADQCDDVSSRWQHLTGHPVPVVAADPYTEPIEAIVTAAVSLVSRGAEELVLDCFGYSSAMGAAVAAATGHPTLVCRLLALTAARDLVTG